MPCLARTRGGDGGELVRLGHPLLDAYLELVAARARWNTVLATAFDLKVFFSVIDKDPVDVVTADVIEFIRAQREPRHGATVVRIEDGESGLSARTIKRRLATIAGLYEYLLVRGDAAVAGNPVPRGLAMRRPGQRPGRGDGRGDAVWRAAPLRGPRAAPGRCPSRRAPAVHRPGQGRPSTDHPGLDPVLHHAGRLSGGRATLTSATDRVFVVLKGRRRGQPLSSAGLDEIVAGARKRAGLERLTCHQLRHTCFTRLREAGMALEAIQAQAGHRSIESTRIYLHLAGGWLAEEYRRASEAIDAQALGGS